MLLQSPVFMSSGLMLDKIFLFIVTDSTEQTTDSAQKHLFSKIQDDTIHLYKGSLQDLNGNEKCWYKKDITFASFN